MHREEIAFIAVGLVLIALGILVWKKQMLRILHEGHYRNVKPEDIPAYTRSMGIGQIVIGAGLGVTGAMRLFSGSILTWAPFAAALVAGFAVLHTAQMRYNGGWFT